jgi:RNA 2',3'-cyclic 3'-phosphodiesterase
VRLFVAAEIDPAITRELARVAGELRARVDVAAPAARLTWIPAERMHFTVRFIGEVDDARAAAIAAALEVPLAIEPFDLVIAGSGTFPPKGSPRVLWVGVAEGRDGMKAVEQQVSARLAVCGIPPEGRAYSPHLTLARVREAGGLRSADVLDAAPQGPFGSTRVDTITLFQSRLSPKGPTYVPVQRTALRAA